MANWSIARKDGGSLGGTSINSSTGVATFAKNETDSDIVYIITATENGCTATYEYTIPSCNFDIYAELSNNFTFNNNNGNMENVTVVCKITKSVVGSNNEYINGINPFTIGFLYGKEISFKTYIMTPSLGGFVEIPNLVEKLGENYNVDTKTSYVDAYNIYEQDGVYVEQGINGVHEFLIECFIDGVRDVDSIAEYDTSMNIGFSFTLNFRTTYGSFNAGCTSSLFDGSEFFISDSLYPSDYSAAMINGSDLNRSISCSKSINNEGDKNDVFSNLNSYNSLLHLSKTYNMGDKLNLYLFAKEPYGLWRSGNRYLSITLSKNNQVNCEVTLSCISGVGGGLLMSYIINDVNTFNNFVQGSFS